MSCATTSALRGILLGLLACLAAAAPAAGAWNVEAVDLGRDMGASSVGFDASGRPAVAYGETRLHYASWNGSSWDRPNGRL